MIYDIDIFCPMCWQAYRQTNDLDDGESGDGDSIALHCLACAGPVEFDVDSYEQTWVSQPLEYAEQMEMPIWQYTGDLTTIEDVLLADDAEPTDAAPYSGPDPTRYRLRGKAPLSAKRVRLPLKFKRRRRKGPE